ncbi:YveK family protein [Dethiobacter alkaliphilus]|uniref:Lipopolysaccharide biosynthesis protein n=1 Tax=Dethiobacter alkaliphilus AHT 1 TaxID=555088 RepID=C0GGR6_DETAL|nr:Wzz/FepE/Etk N-terminal domain-containing protein [Dethiobacter alkaliphilus]EEG77507.1 lipopolysaccharide biosynthesis protein [Dethiobacter alkaliphilus AHT 1]
MEQEIEIREIVAIVSKRWKAILALFIFAVATSLVASLYFIQPVYESSATLLVGKPTEGTQVVIQDVQLNRQLVKTYEEIARSGVVASAVIQDLNLDMSVNQLRGMINVRQVSDTEIISISVSDNSPDRAAFLANSVANTFITKVGTIMNLDNVSIIDEAEPSTSAVSPRPNLNAAIAGVLAIMLGVFMAFALEYMDNTIKTPKDVEQNLELPLLGTIPFFEGE